MTELSQSVCGPEVRDSFIKVKTTFHKMMPRFKTKKHFIEMSRKVQNQRNIKLIN